MRYYIANGIFSLIPKSVYTAEAGEDILRKQFSIGKDMIIKSLDVKDFEAVLVYANIISLEEKYYPLPIVVELLNEIKQISNYNKVIFHFSKEHKMAHIVICTGSQLQLVNSFKSDSFDTALYYLFLSLKQLQINPQQTIIRAGSFIPEDKENIINKYFKGFVYCSNFNEISIL